MTVNQSIFSEAIIDFLSSLKSEKILYCTNPGNAGDSIIATSTFQLFDKLGIKYKLLRSTDLHFNTSHCTVVFGGGGNLVPYYNKARRFIEAHHKRARKLIILPHTIMDNEELLSALGENVDVITREYQSYNHALAHSRRARVLLMHDVALSLDIADLERGSSRFDMPTIHETMKFSRYFLSRMMMGATPNGTTLNCFREDVERSSHPIPPGNVDLPNRLSGGTSPEMIARLVSRDILTILMRYDRVKTNRLHMCILSAMLGKEVIFYDNLYGKNKAVYDFSLKMYPNIIWRG